MRNAAYQFIVTLLMMMSITVVWSAETERSSVQLRGSNSNANAVRNARRERKAEEEEQSDEYYLYDYDYYYNDDGNENGAFDDDDEASLPEEDILAGYVEFYKKAHPSGSDNDRRLQ